MKFLSKLGKNEKRAVLIMTITMAVAFGIFAWLNFANDYYRATDHARKAMLGNETIEVVSVKEEGYYLFSARDKETPREKGIIFYPGGKVEETAYAPLLLELAEEGYTIFLVEMPAKLAIFGMNSAEDIIENNGYIREWTMMGHSLGGAMAASFSASHDEVIDNLVLLAAYSTEDLSDKDIRVYSIYGDKDQVLNMEKYGKYYSNLPENTLEEVIEEGNHANFGNYGNQEGDAEASISREEQQEIVVDIFVNSQK